MKKIIYALMFCGMTSFMLAPGKKITLWLIGDSTISVKDPSAYPETGWGMPFTNFWDSSVKIENRAMNGRSTRSFINEERWSPVVNNLQEGDYVFIQFGHNDEGITKKNYVPPLDYKAYLIKFVSETRQKKAIPILITPVARRTFDSTGHIRGSHDVYSAIVREVAASEQVLLIDLDGKSQALYESLGPQTSLHLFNYLEPGQHPNYPEGKKDNTHFSELGARKIAELVLKEIRIIDTSLAKYIITPSLKK